MTATLNLASRPVRNDRLPALLFVGASLILLLATIHHGMLVRRLLPHRSADLREEVVGLQKEMANLRASSAAWRPQAVAPQQKAEWMAVKTLVDRHMFSWSELFLRLEDALPGEVRIVSVSPHVHDGQYHLAIGARVQTMAAGYNLVRALEQRPEFEDVRPKDCTEQQQGFDCNYAAEYLNQAPPASTGPTQAPPQARPRAVSQ